MNKVRLLLLSYWAAGIADFVFAVIILIPDRSGLTDFVYPMGMFSAVAFSWGILLLLSTKDPFSRRWVLVPTMIVIFLLGVATVYSVVINAIPFGVIAPRLIIKVFLFVLLLFSYIKTGKTERV